MRRETYLQSTTFLRQQGWKEEKDYFTQTIERRLTNGNKVNIPYRIFLQDNSFLVEKKITKCVDIDDCITEESNWVNCSHNTLLYMRYTSADVFVLFHFPVSFKNTVTERIIPSVEAANNVKSSEKAAKSIPYIYKEKPINKKEYKKSSFPTISYDVKEETSTEFNSNGSW
jgi:hypothetical protein